MMRRRTSSAAVFLLPWLVGFVALTVYPFCASLYWSFCRYDVLSPPTWVGGANYARLAEEIVRDGRFGRALWNTLYYATLSVPLSILLGVTLAVMLSWRIRGQSIYRTILFLPSVVPVVAASTLWIWLLDPQDGLVNYVLADWCRLPPQGWLDSTSEALWPPHQNADARTGNVFGSKDGLVLMSLWGVGNFMVIYLAALGDIPAQLYEAARIDGAGAVRRFWHVTLPMLTPVIFFNLIMGFIQSVQAFTQIYLVSDGRGDPAGASLMLSLHLFLAAFKDLDMGYASAMAWILFVLVLAMTAVMFRTSRRWVFYQGVGQG